MVLSEVETVLEVKGGAFLLRNVLKKPPCLSLCDLLEMILCFHLLALGISQLLCIDKLLLNILEMLYHDRHAILGIFDV